MRTDLLTALGWDSVLAAAFAPHDRDGQRPARISRVDRSGFDLLDRSGPVRATAAGSVLALAARDSAATPCVGDWAVLRHWPDDRTTVEALLPRRTAVVRAAARGQSQGQALAANLDVAAVVEPLFPLPELGRLERLLALAWQSGARPAVILTKADIVSDAEDLREDVERAAPGVPVYVVSATTGVGLDQVTALLGPGRTVALLGASGAGKSTLTNALAGTEVMGTRALRGDGKGRHTTTHRELFLLPGGGVVVDTPGLRSVGLYDAAAGLDLVFDDVEQLARECRFNDCRHGTEPGCAVLAAIDAGELPLRRLESWQRLEREMHHIALRQDARLRAAELSKWKQLSRELRHDPLNRRSRNR